MENVLWRRCRVEFDDVNAIWPENAKFNTLPWEAKINILYHILQWIAYDHNMGDLYTDLLVCLASLL